MERKREKLGGRDGENESETGGGAPAASLTFHFPVASVIALCEITTAANRVPRPNEGVKIGTVCTYHHRDETRTRTTCRLTHGFCHLTTQSRASSTYLQRQRRENIPAEARVSFERECRFLKRFRDNTSHSHFRRTAWFFVQDFVLLLNSIK